MSTNRNPGTTPNSRNGASLPTTMLVNVVLKDEPGSLNTLLSMIEKLGVNLSAISSSSDGTTGTSVVTLGFENNRDAQSVVRNLRSNEYTVTTRDAFRLFIPNQPGSLQSGVLRALSRRGININKIISGTNDSVFVLVDNADEAIEVFRPLLTPSFLEEALAA